MTTNLDSPGQDQSASREPRRRHGYDRGEDATTSRTTHALSDICASLTAEWATIASRPPARRTCQSWAQRCPALGGFGSPAEVVATINRLGDPVTSCALLSDLLVLAAEDRLARRAVLQAVLPGQRQVARRRWRRATPRGPWRSQHDVLVDSVGAGWHMITIHSGRKHERPSAVIMRGVEGQLRRAHDRWRTESSNTLALSNLVVEPCDPAWSPEAQAIEFIAAATHAGILTRTEAAILTMSVLGHPIVHAARAFDLPPGHAQRSLTQARPTLRRWLRDPPEYLDVTLLAPAQPRAWHSAPFEPIADLLPAFSSAHQPTKDLPMPPLLLRPTAAARLLDISRSKLYDLINAGEINTVTIGSSRRIIYDDLLAYVQRLQHHRRRDVPGGPKTLSGGSSSRHRHGNSLATRGAATKTSTAKQRVVAADDDITANVKFSGGQHG
jgi:excisionase family DNA binding protein